MTERLKAIKERIANSRVGTMALDEAFRMTAIEDISWLCGRVEAIEKALEKYGRHDQLCAVVGGYDYPCTCGLDEAKSALKGG